MANLLEKKLKAFINNKNSDFESNMQALTNIYNHPFIDEEQFAKFDFTLLDSARELFQMDDPNNESFKFNNIFDYYYFCLERKLKNKFNLTYLKTYIVNERVFLELLLDHRVLSYLTPENHWSDLCRVYHSCVFYEKHEELHIFNKIINKINSFIKEWYVPDFSLNEQINLINDFIEEGSFILTRRQYANLKTSLSDKKQNELSIYLQLSSSDDEFVNLQRENRFKDMEINDQISLII